jgi:hypothetical protein
MTMQNSTSEAMILFVDQLVEEKKFENLDEDVLEQIKTDLLERVEDAINVAILESMPPEKMEEFDQMLDGAEMDEVQKFCQASIPDFENVIAAALMKFRSIYLNS